MDWKDLAGQLIQAGAPLIGGAMGGPLGSLLGNAVGGVLANTLGVDPTPEAVDEAIKKTPPGELQAKLSAAEIEAQARWPALAEIAKAEADAAVRSMAEAQVTARAEMVAADPLQRWWRPIYAIELTIECAAVWLIVIYDVLWGPGNIATLLAQNSALLITYWGARFGVLGVYVQGRSREKEAAITGQLAPSVIEQIVKAVKRK